MLLRRVGLTASSGLSCCNNQKIKTVNSADPLLIDHLTQKLHTRVH